MNPITLKISKGFATVMDEDDFAWFCRWRWSARINSNGAVYVYRNEGPRSAVRTIHLHREILGLLEGYKGHVDHINGNTLDNRKENLRLASCSQNLMNSKKRIDNRSGYKGVSRYRDGRWRAALQIKGRYVFLGYYPTAELAHEAYKKGATEHFGEFARTA